jgi:hypothetical protein
VVECSVGLGNGSAHQIWRRPILPEAARMRIFGTAPCSCISAQLELPRPHAILTVPRSPRPLSGPAAGESSTGVLEVGLSPSGVFGRMIASG